MERLRNYRFELRELAEQEATKLWRLARRAKAHKVSADTVHKIQEEADYCYRTLTTYPERMLEWDFEYKMQYAFKF